LNLIELNLERENGWTYPSLV